MAKSNKYEINITRKPDNTWDFTTNRINNKTYTMNNLQKPNAKRNSSAFLMAIALVVLVFGAVKVTGPQYEAGMIVMLLGGMCMVTGMLSLQD